MRDYTKIVAWQKADDLTVAVYEGTRSFPKDELYALTSQLRRAAYSVPANIVEGSSRESKKDYLHFLYIARGSLSETRYFIHLSRRLKYADDAACKLLLDQANETMRVLAGLINAVEQEAGSVTRVIAKVTSAVVISLGWVIRP
ncbi:MAG: four helix bundle protein [bacterium]